jgi:hypothetical protein
MPKTLKQSEAKPQDFESVAERLGCDPDLKAFDKKLGKIAPSKATAKPRGRK